MYLALFSVAYGSILTFGQAAVLFNILDIENYVSYRAVLNTMNNAAPFICLGFDGAAPVLKRINPSFPFFWNILFFHCGGLFLFIISALALPNDSKLLPLVLGLAASFSVAGALIIANHYRAEGAITRYFISVNIVDKSVRTLLIISLAFLLKNTLLWSIILSLLCFLYVGLVASKTGVKLKLDAHIFLSHIRISFPYIFASLGIIAIARMPFYAAYTFDDKMFTAKIDIWLLFSLFLLIPVLNKSKVEESKSTGLAQEYVTAMKHSWSALRKQELLICAIIISAASVSILSGYSVKGDLIGIVLPLMVGMIIISSQPNYVHILCFLGYFKFAIKVSFIIVFFSIFIYIPKFFEIELSVPDLFIGSAVIYCMIGCTVARLIEVKISDFWRWRDSLLLICFTIAATMVVNYFIVDSIL